MDGDPVVLPARPGGQVVALAHRRSGAGVPVVLGSRSLRRPSAELFEQSDHHGVGSADVAEPIAVLVLRQLSDKFGAVGAQAGK